jgi:glycosyltransferase involved in cell wall biosynthesis
MDLGEVRMSGARVWWVNQYAVTPDRPGGTRHHEMAAALRARGRDVVVVASDLDLGTRRYTRRNSASDRRHLREDVDGVPFVWLPAGSYERNDWRRAASMLVFSAHLLPRLLRDVRSGDTVIGSSPHLPGALAAWVVARLRRAAFILEVRDLWPESLVEVLGRTNLAARILRVIADHLYRRSDAVLVLARGSEDNVVARGGRAERVHWIPNGVTVDAAPSAPLPDDLAWMREHATFVYAGAHGPANGLDVALDAARILRDADESDPVDRSILILLVGDGVEKARLAGRVLGERLENVVLHDPVPKATIPALLDAATGGLMLLRDVGLFRYGVSPNKLFDYLAADLPVISNVQGEVADIVTRSDGGIVVAPEDADALVAAMRRIAWDGWPRGGGPAYIRQQHDRVVLAERLDEIIAGVAHPKKDERSGIGS